MILPSSERDNLETDRLPVLFQSRVSKIPWKQQRRETKALCGRLRVFSEMLLNFLLEIYPQIIY